jgi:hypothetical protein
VSHIVGQDKSGIDEAMAHFGVKGMKWGVRKQASTSDIKGARKRFGRKVEDFHDQKRELRETTRRGTQARAAGEKRLGKLEMKLLQDPDRATAFRLTRGEKWIIAAVGAGGTVATGALLPAVAGAGVLATRSLVSRGIEAKQKQRDNKK